MMSYNAWFEQEQELGLLDFERLAKKHAELNGIDLQTLKHEHPAELHLEDALH